LTRRRLLGQIRRVVLRGAAAARSDQAAGGIHADLRVADHRRGVELLGRVASDELGGAVEPLLVGQLLVGEGRETETKAIVVMAAEENGSGTSRIRLQRVMDVSGDSLISFVDESGIPASCHGDQL